MALTITWNERVHLGNKFLASALVTGDAATTTITMPLSKVESCWIQRVTETSNLGLSYATNIITYSSAPAALTHIIFAIGWD